MNTIPDGHDLQQWISSYIDDILEQLPTINVLTDSPEQVDFTQFTRCLDETHNKLIQILESVEKE